MGKVQEYLSARDTTDRVQIHLMMDAVMKKELQKLANKNKLSLTSTINRCLAYSLDSNRKGD